MVDAGARPATAKAESSVPLANGLPPRPLTGGGVGRSTRKLSTMREAQMKIQLNKATSLEMDNPSK